MPRSGKLLVLVFITFLIFFMGNARPVLAWSNSSFDRCMNITILNVGSSTLTNFPAYINLTYDADMQPDFKDIRFYNTACNNVGTQLDYEIENYTASDRAHAWVRLPSLPSSGTTISIYYKNNTAVGSGENQTGVWDSYYVGVWHMQKVNATDSTSFQNNGTQNGGMNSTSSGKIDGADEFDGAGTWINVTHNSVLNVNPDNFSVAAWIYPKENTTSEIYYVVAKFNSTSPFTGYLFRIISDDMNFIFTDGLGNLVEVESAGDLVKKNLWNYIVATFNGTELMAYVNGQNVNSTSTTYKLAGNSKDLGIGVGYNYSFWYYNGTIDEVCISNTTRNAVWINQSYQMIANQASFVSFGSEQTTPYVQINNCSTLNTPGGAYILVQDITNSPNTTCMNINADNITLDCGGYKIDGVDSSNTYGIYMNGRKNITIRNCNISDWWYGIYFSSTNSSVVWQSNVSYNTFGIYMTAGSTMNNISKARVSKNDRNGIELASSSSYNSIENSVIHENSYNGIYSSSSHWNNLTNLSLYSNTLSGINLSSSQNYTILLCNASSNIIDGIYLLSSDWNRIENTTTALNDYSGIYVQSSSRNNISGTNASANDYYGICLISSSSSNVLFNTTTNNNQGSGIYLESSSSNNTATKCTSSVNTVYGIIVQLSPDNNFTGCQLNSNKDQGIRLYDCSNNYFIDSIINGSTNNDVYATSPGTSNNYFINTTFNKTNTSINNNAIIWVKWYLYVKMLSKDESPLGSVNIAITNKYNTSVFSGLTNATGDITRQILTEYNETSSGKNYYTNYTINASKTGFVENQSYVNLTSTRIEIIYLEAVGPPSVQVKIYTLGLVESDIVKPERIVRIRTLVTYSIGRVYLKNSTIVIKDDASSIVVNKELMSNVSEITNGYVYEYNYTIPGNAKGIWLVNVTAASSTGAEGYGSKKMAIIPLNIKIKLVLNSTSDSIYIPGTGERAFSDLTTAEYTIPSHYYIASYYNNILKGVVLSSTSPISIATEKGSNTYGMGTVQRLSNSMVFIVFSRGSWNEINNRISSIERGEFLLSSEPSFSFGLGKAYPFKVILEYQNIDINKTIKIGRGYNGIVVENLGKSGEKVNLIIKRA